MDPPVVVLGMHKSGTTLVSRMLHSSGIAMTEQESALGYDAGNHYERAAMKELNKTLLNCGDATSFLVRDRLDPQAVTARLRAQCESVVAVLQAEGAAWGFKDPRTCLTYDFWFEILPGHKVVAVIRDPQEVYTHYRTHNAPQRGMGRAILRTWFMHNRVVADVVRRNPEGCLLIDYGALMDGDSELRRLERFLNRPITDHRTSNLRRSVAEPPKAYDWDRRTLRWLYGTDVAVLRDQLLELRRLQVEQEVAAPV